MTDPRRGPREPRFGAIRIAEEDGDAVLVLTGEVDIVAVGAFEASHAAVPSGVTAIDAGDVTLLSATAVSLMLAVVNAARAAGRTVVLRRSNPHVDRVLDVLDVAAAFPR